MIAWAHGTTAMASACSPSLVADLAHDSRAVDEVRALLANGWAVVATDYLGLGAPGVHRYLMGAVNGAAVVDSVLAAHQLPIHLSRDWVVVGHSAARARSSPRSRLPGPSSAASSLGVRSRWHRREPLDHRSVRRPLDDLELSTSGSRSRRSPGVEGAQHDGQPPQVQRDEERDRDERGEGNPSLGS